MPDREPCRKNKNQPAAKARNMFEDGTNSLWHVAFGVCAYYAKLGVLVYTIYQTCDFGDANFSVDMLEFLTGYVAAYIIESR
jgi:hypothetical protein